MHLCPRLALLGTAIALTVALGCSRPATLETAAVVQERNDPRTLAGKVVSIADLDTITVLVDKKQHRVRLEGIDCPESGQPFGKRAKQFTAELCFGKRVSVEQEGVDRYGRILGEVFVRGVSVNREMLKAGWAWHFKKYNQDENLAPLEAEARTEKRGLFADPNAIAPWEWRKQRREL